MLKSIITGMLLETLKYARVIYKERIDVALIRFS